MLRSTTGVVIDDIALNYGLVAPSPRALVDWHAAAYGEKAGGGGDHPEAPTEQLLVSSATTLAGALAQVWAAVALLAGEGVAPGLATTLLFPACSALAARGTLEKLMDHLETCKDVCDRFGATVVPFALDPNAPTGHPMHGPAPGLRLQVLGASKERALNDWNDEWDDDWDLDPTVLEAIRQGAVGELSVEGLSAAELASLNAVPESDDQLVEVSKDWVAAMVADMGVCPFTTSSEKAGLPLGTVHYPVTRAATAEQVYAAYWHQVALLESSPPRQLSTTLLLTPHFGLANAEAFMALSDTLTNPLESLALEATIQLVFFHPQWAFRDGAERVGGATAGNFARRSPFPMINILRTPQVRIAQRSIPTGLVYQQNEASLAEVGAATLQGMLVARDWSGLAAHKVDRNANELFNTARQLVEKYANAPAEDLGSSPLAAAAAVCPVAVGPGSTSAAAAVAAVSPPATCPMGAPIIAAAAPAAEMDIDAMLAALEELEVSRLRS